VRLGLGLAVRCSAVGVGVTVRYRTVRLGLGLTPLDGDSRLREPAEPLEPGLKLV
jgi:hypothetical protein